MKGIYVSECVEASLGVKKKIEMQIRAFKKYGIDIKWLELEKKNKIQKIGDRIPIIPIYKYKIDIDEFREIDFIYIRKNIINFQFINMIQRVLKVNKNIKILMEIPTFPYDQELENTLRDKCILINEKFWRRNLVKYIDRIITFSSDEYIWGIKTLNIQNGIDTDIIKVKENIINNDCINLIGVASLKYWHGYDRVILGLEEYYNEQPNTKVIFHIVGEGEELSHLKKLSEEKMMNKYVKFYGSLTGKELDDIYNISDIGVGVLGLHRKGLMQVSDLKSREYCAKGIPFIKSNIDHIFDSKEFKYMLNYSADDTIISIPRIVEFIEKNIKASSVREIREFCEKELTWERQFQKVVEFLEINKQE